jgi:hypothetical protein
MRIGERLFVLTRQTRATAARVNAKSSPGNGYFSAAAALY